MPFPGQKYAGSCYDRGRSNPSKSAPASDPQAANGKLCGQVTATMAAGGLIAGAKAGVQSGKSLCTLPAALFPSAGPISYGACMGGFALGGASSGLLGGMMGAMLTPPCQNSAFNASQNVPTGKPSSAPSNAGGHATNHGGNLPPCPTHGAHHSCARPPSRGNSSGHGFGCSGHACGGCK